MSNEPIRCDSWRGRAKIGGELWAAILVTVVGGLIAAGGINAAQTILDRRVTVLENKSDAVLAGIAALNAKVDILLEDSKRRR